MVLHCCCFFFNFIFKSTFFLQPNIWKDYGKNKQSIGELWVGFFNFYLEKFSFNRNVVSIKQINSVLKFKKSWMRYKIAIEGIIFY